MTVLDRVAKTKGALTFEKVQVPQRASRFFFVFFFSFFPLFLLPFLHLPPL